jgi:uncharacterized protein
MDEAKRWGLGALGLAGAAISGYALLVEPIWIEVRRVRVHISDLHPALEGLRIGLLTDLHAGDRRSLRLVRKACRLLMKERPAIIAIAGDFADRRTGTFRPVLEALAALEAPHGVFAVPGNHDHKIGFRKWRRDLILHSTILDLTNRSTRIRIGSARLCLAGVDDFVRGTPSLDSLPPPGKRDLTILLAHNPDQAERSRRRFDRVDLVLSGHTHGGQVRLPGIGPILSSVEHDDLYEEGLRRRPWTQVYTSRGLGTIHVRARFLTRPEVSVVELTGAPRPPR